MHIKLINYNYLDESQHQTLLALRNRPFVRALMDHQSEIKLKEHVQFVSHLKEAKDKLYFAVVVDNELMGSISAKNLHDRHCEWGVYFDPNAHFLANCLVVYTFFDFLFTQKGLQKVYSRVKPNNARALSFNQSFGFIQIEEDASYHHLFLDKARFLNAKQVKVLQKKLTSVMIEVSE